MGKNKKTSHLHFWYRPIYKVYRYKPIRYGYKTHRRPLCSLRSIWSLKSIRSFDTGKTLDSWVSLQSIRSNRSLFPRNTVVSVRSISGVRSRRSRVAGKTGNTARTAFSLRTWFSVRSLFTLSFSWKFILISKKIFGGRFDTESGKIRFVHFIWHYAYAPMSNRPPTWPWCDGHLK